MNEPINPEAGSSELIAAVRRFQTIKAERSHALSRSAREKELLEKAVRLAPRESVQALPAAHVVTKSEELTIVNARPR